eukprot:jgi/Mesen1/2666/ME000167S01816
MPAILRNKDLSADEAFCKAAFRCLESRHAQPASRGVVTAVFEIFTERAVKSVMLAQREAKAMGRGEVGTEQLLLGLIAEERDSVGFLKTGVTIERARDAVRSYLEDQEVSSMAGSEKPASEVPFSSGSKLVFEVALEESRKMGHNYIAPEHLAIAVLAVEEGGAAKIVDRLGLRKDKLHEEAISRLKGELAKEGRSTAGMAAAKQTVSSSTATSVRSSNRKEKGGALADFCVDITARAAQGLIDPVIGRDKEVQRVVEILARRTKNNPILLGEPGVGKTAIAEGLATRIVAGNVPEFLAERGELETRVTSLIEETIKAGNVVLLIDEVHTLVGSGSVGRGGQGGGLDISNLLKPALARGQLQCIGATTLDEHRKHIEKDKALARRFQPVMVLEPSPETATEILLGIKDKYEAYHRCHITEEAVHAAVQLSARYISDRFLPDKAIDLMDEAGSRARIGASLRKRRARCAVLAGSPADYWSEIRSVLATHEGGSDAMRQSGGPVSFLGNGGMDVDSDSRGSAVTVTTTLATNMEAELASMRSSFDDEDLDARYEEAMVRLDMSEYMERHTVSKLVGSPPGYVGYGDGGTLTEAVRRRPFTVILLDEIEKAHPDVFNLLLQLFEDGRLTDSQGRKVSFKNTLIVMTSNIGSSQIARGGSNRIGFQLPTEDADGGRYAALKELVMDELKGYFRPELLNRLDEVVVFRSLEKSQVREIVDMMLEETKARMRARGVGLEISEALIARIGDEGYDRAYGARPLRRAVTRLVEDPLSEALLQGAFEAGDTALVDVGADGGEPCVSHYKKPDVCDHGLCLSILKPSPVPVSSLSD